MSKCKCEGNTDSLETIPNFTVSGFKQEENLQATTQDLSSYLSQDVLALDLKVCVAAALINGKICFTLPIYGDFCIKPPINITTSGKITVCAQTCTKFNIPSGVKISVYLNEETNPTFTSTLIGFC